MSVCSICDHSRAAGSLEYHIYYQDIANSTRSSWHAAHATHENAMHLAKMNKSITAKTQTCELLREFKGGRLT